MKVPSPKAAELQTHGFTSPAAFAAWLRKNHANSPGIWLRIARKNSGIVSITYAQALEEALCHGWIDGQRKAESDKAFLQRFTPRGSRSIWSQINREKALALIKTGRMKAAGQHEIDRATKDGRWDAAYESQSVAGIPDDLAAKLKKAPKALAFFESLDSRNRYAILFRLHHAKKQETRLKRLETFVAMLKNKETIYPPAKKRAASGT